MSSRRLIDTNLIIRFLVQDHEKHAKVARGCSPHVTRETCGSSCCRSCWPNVYLSWSRSTSIPAADIARVLADLVKSPGVELANLASYVDALERYSRSNAHFVDCVLAATAAAETIPVASFDNDFRKFVDVEVRID